MSDEVPTVYQIAKAEPHLAQAHRVSVVFEACGPRTPEAHISRRLFQSYIEQAARALGFKLVPLTDLHIVVTDSEPNTMREAQ